MPNVVQVLKEEIARISRREAKAAVAPFRKPSVRYRKDIADLKRRMAALAAATRQIQARLAKMDAARPTAPAAGPEARGWISGKGIRSLRKRLGLSQSEFARLVGVSDQAIYTWESKAGMLKFRGDTKAKVFAVRGIGAREARQRLAETKPATREKAVARKRKSRGMRGRQTAKG